LGLASNRQLAELHACSESSSSSESTHHRTMKLSFVDVLFTTRLLLAEPTSMVFRPTQVPLSALLDPTTFEAQHASSVWNALTTVGMISITDIHDWHAATETLLSSMADCVDIITNDNDNDDKVLPDGSRRRSVATYTGPGGVPHPLFQDRSTAASCRAFDDQSLAFRETVALVTQAFAERLSGLLSKQEHRSTTTTTTTTTTAPLLSTPEGITFDTFAAVVENGEHLEHFHSYQKTNKGQQPGSSKSLTIDWHVDQGLFIVFTPGRIIQQHQGNYHQYPSHGFAIQLQDGSQAAVDFDPKDELVILLGDGMHQLVPPPVHDGDNDHEDPGSSTLVQDRLALLRATPHALTMPPTYEDDRRVWYGRMVLPPSRALHPQPNGDRTTFGRRRDLLVDKINNNNAVRLGCSSFSNARQLETTLCEQDGTIRCWHRCMLLSEGGISSEETCTTQGLSLVCTNPRGQVSDGNTHGDFFPGCVDLTTATNVTDFPTLPKYPRDEQVCNDEEFAAFYKTSNSTDYEHELVLSNSSSTGQPQAIFQWSVVGDSVKGKLYYNGLFGYLAIGLAKYPVGVGIDAMLGAIIVMALPGTNYNATTGLDLSGGANVHEYQIDASQSSFRHWDTPLSSSTTTATARVSSNVASYVTDTTECFTALSFDTPYMYDRKFNVTGTDHLIWAANGVDYFASYHTARGHIIIHWPTGVATTNGNGGDHDHDDDHEEGGTATGPTSLATTRSAAVLSLAFLGLVNGCF
jgi:hypothetical protein